jgi:hypothetical protein
MDYRITKELEAQLERVEEQRAGWVYLERQGDRARVLLHLIEEATTIARGCVALSREDLALPMLVLCRVLLEVVIVSYWISKSEENAEEYVTSLAKNHAKFLWVNADRGYVALKDRETGEDVTAKVLEVLKEEKGSPPSVEHLAKETGLETLYDFGYRYLSVYPHVNTFQGDGDLDKQGPFAAKITLEILQKLIVIGNNTLRQEQDTRVEDVLCLQHLFRGGANPPRRGE